VDPLSQSSTFAQAGPTKSTLSVVPMTDEPEDTEDEEEPEPDPNLLTTDKASAGLWIPVGPVPRLPKLRAWRR
jgi:hypothetical protein